MSSQIWTERYTASQNLAATQPRVLRLSPVRFGDRMVSMSQKIPFVGKIFWTVFVVVGVLGVAAWVVAIKVFAYEMQSQDYGGSVITWVIFSYLVHLWLLPEEQPPQDP